MADILKTGSKAPDFTLPADDGGSISLNKLKGMKVVVYFYPRANTTGCTKEAIAFNALKPQFERVDTVILGVSADPVPAQARFKEKYALAFPLLSDQGHRMLLAYAAWGKKSLYGRSFMGVKRMTYLIDRNSRIAQVWAKVKVEGHAEEVLAAAQVL